MLVFSLWLILLLAAGGRGTSEQAVIDQVMDAREPAKSVVAYPRTSDGRLILTRLPASTDASLVFEVAIGACVNQDCPVLISLSRGDTLLDQKRTEWSSRTTEPTQEELDPGWGAGDPVGPAAVTAWSTGEEEGYLGTAVRPVLLSVDTHGLLIDQRTGFEHLKRRHELYVVLDNKLERVWEAAEGAGPAWTSTAIVPLKDDRQGILYFNGFLYPLHTTPDQLEISLLAWEPRDRKLKKQPQFTVQAVVVAGYTSVAAAQRARTAQPECLGLFWVLPATRLSGAASGRYVLALPGSSAANLKKALQQTTACIKHKHVSLASVR